MLPNCPMLGIIGRYLFYYLSGLRESKYLIKLRTYVINTKLNKCTVNVLISVASGRNEQNQVVGISDVSLWKIDSAENKERTLLHELMTAKTRIHEPKLFELSGAI